MISFTQSIGWIAPLFFIVLHLVRPMLFIPIVLICIPGGILFGPVLGSLYSLIGLTLSSCLFYGLLNRFGYIQNRFRRLRKRWFGEHRSLNVKQITILKLIPFMHYQLLTFFLMERSSSFKDYVIKTIWSNIPLVLVYTLIGRSISTLSPLATVVFVLLLLIISYYIREKYEVMKLRDFVSKKQVDRVEKKVRMREFI
ncbi:hypothetical protein Q73_10750 [Bacillus coahuilensis m2-6]|uniref:TVP38/TMEM64 family membrane protein n=2 Tax=Bacillus coahuilensis TaxID=408580 RepID=A0A147K6W5_9BACI|nr:hypothetical protein Q75_11345 [Bacillus coahuilensis p1.1.43]KUP06732.1 hypothetical protein Q73_10750 [Bacillus coahuilensis m2-6]